MLLDSCKDSNARVPDYINLEYCQVSVIDVADFFCGCGGTSAGMRNAGMHIVAGIDNDSEAGASFEKNFPEAVFVFQDIRLLQPYDLYPLFPRARYRPLLFSACAPCQPFTKQRTKKYSRDNRVSLLDEFHRFVQVFRPEYIFIENVAGLQHLNADEGPLGRFNDLLDQLKYTKASGVLRAQDYGVPQYRQRFVLLASLLGKFEWPPRATHGPGTGNCHFETVWNSIGNLPAIAAGEEDGTILNHRAANLSALNLKRIALTPPGGGRRHWPEELRLPCHEGHTGHSDVYGRLHKDRPASALTTRCISLSNGRYGHPTQDRAISVREAARLQTFKDVFEFEGTMTSMARQIGNAVPVKFAQEFGNHIWQHYSASQLKSGVE